MVATAFDADDNVLGSVSAAISGGTDVAASYVGACPIQPVYAGEMQCRYLGTAVYAMDDDGRILDDEVGELVVTKPMPSMPLYCSKPLAVPIKFA